MSNILATTVINQFVYILYYFLEEPESIFVIFQLCYDLQVYLDSLLVVCATTPISPFFAAKREWYSSGSTWFDFDPSKSLTSEQRWCHWWWRRCHCAGHRWCSLGLGYLSPTSSSSIGRDCYSQCTWDPRGDYLSADSWEPPGHPTNHSTSAAGGFLYLTNNNFIHREILLTLLTCCSKS